MLSDQDRAPRDDEHFAPFAVTEGAHRLTPDRRGVLCGTKRRLSAGDSYDTVPWGVLRTEHGYAHICPLCESAFTAEQPAPGPRWVKYAGTWCPLDAEGNVQSHGAISLADMRADPGGFTLSVADPPADEPRCTSCARSASLREEAPKIRYASGDVPEVGDVAHRVGQGDGWDADVLRVGATAIDARFDDGSVHEDAAPDLFTLVRRKTGRVTIEPPAEPKPEAPLKLGNGPWWTFSAVAGREVDPMILLAARTAAVRSGLRARRGTVPSRLNTPWEPDL